MEDIRKLLVYFRNALAFSYSWLVLCVVLLSLAGGNGEVKVIFLVKLLALCIWGSLVFVCLTAFFVLFVPVEVLMFYLMGIFEGVGTPSLWIALAVIVAVFYISAILIDVFVMRRRSRVYTDKLIEYNAKKSAAK